MTSWAVSTAQSSGIATFNKEVIIGMELLTNNPSAGQNVSAAAYYNGEPYHARPIAVILLVFILPLLDHMLEILVERGVLMDPVSGHLKTPALHKPINQ